MKRIKKLDDYAINEGRKGKVIKAPGKLEGGPSVFLAGSIEMGKAEDWQKTAEKFLVDSGVVAFNPRRDDWDSSWEQKMDNEKFREQVNWELDALDLSDAILMYFSPETKSPISLLELGLYAHTGKMFVVCPEGFWRKGNVDIVCARYSVPMFNTIDDALGAIMTRLSIHFQ